MQRKMNPVVLIAAAPKFQVNWANSIGYRTASWTVTGVDAGGIDVLTVSFPLALRTAIGMRYFLTESIGLNAELGLGGGSNVHAGLTFKL